MEVSNLQEIPTDKFWRPPGELKECGKAQTVQTLARERYSRDAV